jgi:hypothetical protein
MTILAFVLFCLCLGLSTALFYSVRRNLQYLELAEISADSVEESLRELEYYYGKIDRKSKMDLFLDEPVTRELMEDIKGTKKAIKKIAEKFSVLIDEESEEQREK